MKYLNEMLKKLKRKLRKHSTKVIQNTGYSQVSHGCYKLICGLPAYNCSLCVFTQYSVIASVCFSNLYKYCYGHLCRRHLLTSETLDDRI